MFIEVYSQEEKKVNPHLKCFLPFPLVRSFIYLFIYLYPLIYGAELEPMDLSYIIRGSRRRVLYACLCFLYLRTLLLRSLLHPHGPCLNTICSLSRTMGVGRGRGAFILFSAGWTFVLAIRHTGDPCVEFDAHERVGASRCVK